MQQLVVHGVLKYAWSASQYLELIIEVIFGIDSDARNTEVNISPNLSDELKKEKISITNLMVFDGIFLNVFITKRKINYEISDNRIKVNVYE